MRSFTCFKSLDASISNFEPEVSHAPLPLRDVAVGADSAGLGVADTDVDFARLFDERDVAVLGVSVVAHFSLKGSGKIT